MLSYKQFLTERYINLFTPEEKKPYVNDVWDILQKSYELHGGIKGKGFSSKEEMLNEPNTMWKLNKQDDKIINVVIYSGKRGGRKLVASGVIKDETGRTNKDAKIKYQKSRIEELTTGRSWMEVSHSSLKSIIDVLGDKWKKYIIPIEEIYKLFPDDKIIPTYDGYYKRKIGGEFIEKIALGSISGSKIYYK